MWPRRTRRPTWPSPGVVGLPSSSMTRVWSPKRNWGRPCWSVLLPVPWKPVSEAPSASKMMMWGSSSESRAFTDGEKIAPPELTRNNEDRSTESSSVSRASARGRAWASPTRDIDTVRVSAVMRHTSAGSRWWAPLSTRTWPPKEATMLVHWAAPCIRGATGKVTTTSDSAAALGHLGLLLEGRGHGGHDGADGRLEEVLLAPHHALRHAGGATGVEHVEVVTGPLLEAPFGRRCGERLFVVLGAAHRDVGTGAVVEGQAQLQQRALAAYSGDARRELRTVDRGEIGVVEQVRQLVLDVAVVDVDRHGPQLPCCPLGLDPLRGVVGVDADLVAGADPPIGQCMGQAVGAGVELGEGALLRAADGIRHDQRCGRERRPPRIRRGRPGSSSSVPPARRCPTSVVAVRNHRSAVCGEPSDIVLAMGLVPRGRARSRSRQPGVATIP